MNKLKKFVLLSLLLTTCVGAYAQETRAGFKGGLNLSNLFIDSDDVDDENMRIGFNFGVYGQFLNDDEMIGLQTEVLLSTKGAKGNYDFIGLRGERKFNLLYVDVPVMLVIKPVELIDIHGGMYVGYLLAASTSTEGDLGSDYDELNRDNYNKVDYGLSIGAALNFDVISFGARYNYGLQKIAKSDSAEAFLGDSRNSVAQVYVTINL